jgi:hypothetical protein
MIDLDEALERFQIGGFEYGSQIPNYGPMAAEALVALGHGVLITGLVDQYAPRLPARGQGVALSQEEEPEALGCADRVEDWLASYEDCLSREPWQEVVAREMERLSGGISGASVHGLIRVGHALRSLEREETPTRVRELAFGLAYWAACYRDGQGGDGRSGLPDVATEPVGASESIARACHRGAERYLANPEDRATSTLGVTAPAALRLLSPWLDDSIVCRMLDGLPASAREDSAGGRGPVEADAGKDPEVVRCGESLDETRYRAACSLQEHAITFAEACLRENALAPDPVLRLAAADAALRLNPVGYQALR